MGRVPWWAVLSSSAAPVVLISGWTVAAGRQRAGFDPVRESISALAAADADSRWLMTAALAGVGVCHIATAAGLRPAAGPGRVVLGLGGVGTLAVAALPLPADRGGSVGHGVAAAVAFGGLALWPALSARSRSAVALWGLRRSVTIGATGVLVGLLGWFVGQLGGGPWLGLTERVAAGAQAVWPMVVVLGARRFRLVRLPRPLPRPQV